MGYITLSSHKGATEMVTTVQEDFWEFPFTKPIINRIKKPRALNPRYLIFIPVPFEVFPSPETGIIAKFQMDLVLL